jgi:YfiH family protein
MITLPLLAELPGIHHGFLTREGGVSEGIYAGLNCGYGSADNPDHVRENRDRAVQAIGLPADALVTVHQVHSPDVVTVTTAWMHGDAPRADAMVTNRPGIALGILTADCVPVLFCDAQAGVVGAAHAGWKGAAGGVLAATVAAMQALGADPARIRAAVGPHIAWDSYEVGPEFRDRFLTEDAAQADLFKPSRREGHWMFHLAAYVDAKLRSAGIRQIAHAGQDTVTQEEKFFSYRRTTLRGEPDYGRGISIIALG